MDTSPRERALGGHFYGRIRKLMDNGELTPPQRVDAQRRLLLELFERATEADKLHFSTVYARVTYAAHKYGLSRQLIFQERAFRRMRQREMADDLAEPQVRIGYRLLCELTETLFGVDVPEDLQPYLEAAYPKYQQPEVSRHFYQLRVVYLETDVTAQEILVREERRPEMIYRIPYGESELADSPVREAVSILHKISGPFITLNLINAQLRGEDRLYPSQLVIEPDFLVNVTDVAYCFSSGSHYQPWSSLPNRLLPFEKRPPLVRGNIVNTFLDLLVQDPDIRFRDVLPKIFEMQPLELCLFSDAEVRDLVSDLKHHFLTVSRFVRELLTGLDIERDKVMLEPTFLSPAYGLQGRLDLLQSQRDTEEGLTSIVELKTSKIFNPNVHGIRSDNFVQTVLYDLMINQALGKEANVRSYILYSVDYDKPIRYAPAEFNRQMEALSARNQLVGLEMMIAQLGQPSADGEWRDLREQTDALFARIHPSRFKNLGRFTEADHQAVLECYGKLNDLERRYFGAYLGFVAREQRLSKIGEQRTDHLNGLASLWLDERADKVERFELLDGLRFTNYDTDENILTLSRGADDDLLVKFRQGDIVALYGTPEQQARTGDAVHSQIFKSTIVSVANDELLLRPRNRQLNDSAFRRKPFWAVEKDVLDSSFRNHYLGLHLWASSTPEFRQRWLGLAPPHQAAPHPSRVSDELTEEQDHILRKVITAPDYFLLWGPPGTGKTSKMLHHLVRHLLKHSQENVLLVAYTNRAVDEICESIERILADDGSPFRDYLRIGSRLGASEAYKDRLLQVRSQGVTRRKDLLALVKNTRIVVGTVASVGGNNELFKLKAFDRIIVDEASQILEPLLGTLLTRAHRSLLIGDHRQLPAVVQQSDYDTYVGDEKLRTAGVKNLGTSLFERLYLTAKANDWTWAYDQLRHQGRMHREVMAFPALHFYQGALDILPPAIDHHRHQIAELALVAGDNTLQEQISAHRLVFIDAPADRGSADPKINRHEADLLVGLVEAFTAVYSRTDHPVRTGDIGIITPYRAQIALIRSRLAEAGFAPDDYTVDTVERYQGSAKRIVLMSLCTNDVQQLDRMAQISEEGVDRKLNVAMTRARDHLVLVGCPDILQTNDVYAKLLAHVRTTPVDSCN
ncbi:DEAD/DEAH box helicase [Lewinella sp. IMCC34191]|uniref:DEAD/DEAH box helicase n=1 Tax=Lewinella sp. IMCC34191 TaxID=2259172 RepID=UPI000E236C7E|nr:AAA domain-containing protein [Lewinella sp. IMCC34191]